MVSHVHRIGDHDDKPEDRTDEVTARLDAVVAQLTVVCDLLRARLTDKQIASLPTQGPPDGDGPYDEAA